VYDKLVRTALRYTPVVLEHHVPYKTLPNGRLYVFSLLAMLSHDLHIANSKAPTQTHKLKTLQKLITSFFHNTIHIISQLSDTELLKMAVTESTKVLPYVLSSRKTVKLYLKVSIACFFPLFPYRSYMAQACLDLWSTADDSVRIATIRAMHRLASASDESILDLVLRVSTRIEAHRTADPHWIWSEHLPNVS
jgi:nucleolar complex protein 2